MSKTSIINALVLTVFFTGFFLFQYMVNASRHPLPRAQLASTPPVFDVKEEKTPVIDLLPPPHLDVALPEAASTTPTPPLPLVTAEKTKTATTHPQPSVHHHRKRISRPKHLSPYENEDGPEELDTADMRMIYQQQNEKLAAVREGQPTLTFREIQLPSPHRSALSKAQ